MSTYAVSSTNGIAVLPGSASDIVLRSANAGTAPADVIAAADDDMDTMESLASASSTGLTEPGTDSGRIIKLTKREVEVLTLVIEGNSSKEVADRLYVSKRTVDFHLANIYHKLNVTNRVQAFREATKRGLIPFNIVGSARQ